jgi:hypothetical protein
VEALSNYVKEQLSKVDLTKQPVRKEGRPAVAEAARGDGSASHPGCLLAGFLLVNRVPGNFHIEARSNFHNINPVMANLSHVVNQLSFGPPLSKSDLKLVYYQFAVSY